MIHGKYWNAALLALIIAPMAGPAFCQQPAVAADEVVAVDEIDLSAYWRANPIQPDVVQLSGDGLNAYGCLAVPFSLEPNGQRIIGIRPLLMKLGQAGNDRLKAVDLYPFAVQALPVFEPTWDKPLSATIYTSYSVVFTDADLKTRLGNDKWQQAVDALRRACQIRGLADWVGKNPDRTVEERLPADPEQLSR